MKIGAYGIGPDHPPFVVAELSGNHGGSLERARALVEAAAEAGAHAIKLQTYTPDTMTIDVAEREFVIDDPESPWHGSTLYDLYERAQTPWEWHAELFELAAARGMAAFSSPFDATAVDFLETLGVPAYKIASLENVDLPLIRRVAATGKPMIISTGLATLAEIDLAVAAAMEAGARELALLQCTTSYPADPSDSNLAVIPRLRELFGCEVGLSDHTLGVGAPLAAVALGATIVEKHLTLRRSDDDVDAAFSMEPDELAQLVLQSEVAWRARGTVAFGPSAGERTSLRLRRSLYVTSDLEAGAVLDETNVRAIRPGLGLAPVHLDAVLGRRVRTAVPRGTPLRWDLLG